jgi:hypothetical protein
VDGKAITSKDEERDGEHVVFISNIEGGETHVYSRPEVPIAFNLPQEQSREESPLPRNDPKALNSVQFFFLRLKASL